MNLLEKFAESFDIPIELHRAAVEEYEQLAFFLEDLDKQAGRPSTRYLCTGIVRVGYNDSAN